MSGKAFLSGNEAVAEGVRLSRPHVISAYPITPQTTVVEKLSEMVEEGRVQVEAEGPSCEFLHVESEHSALSAAMGASSVGARTFTATSSQGLLYMAECLQYASGGRFPIVMMNANRATALPWNIYGDQRDSLSQLDCGWIQVYTENAQESLDMVLQAYAIAENQQVLTPVMINLDGFVLTHTYELVEIPEIKEADTFLPSFQTPCKMDLESPVNMAFSAGPADNMEFKYQQHLAMLKAKSVIAETDERFSQLFGRRYGGMVEEYRAEDAEFLLITVGSITGVTRMVVDDLRSEGTKVGLLKLRFLRPFPEEEIGRIAAKVKGIGTLEKDISFGAEGTVYTNVNSALIKAGLAIPSFNFVAGLGGRDVSRENIKEAFRYIRQGAADPTMEKVVFLGLAVQKDE